MDSRFRGNDVIFERAQGDEESRTALKTLRARFLPIAALGVGMTCWRWFSPGLGAKGHHPLPLLSEEGSHYHSPLPAHFFQVASSVNILINMPPTTERAWNPACLPSVV